MQNGTTRTRTLVAWSTGKDSAWALHVLRQDPTIEIVGLFSTVDQASARVAMHGVRADLLHQQAASVGLPLVEIPIPDPCSEAEYEAAMGGFIEQIKREHIECVAFGDIFLDDIRQYRERKLARTGIKPMFPLWRMPTDELASEMVRDGLRATITCVDLKSLPVEFAGLEYDASFLTRLPDRVDPCGENGEFHTFVFDGPMFSTPIETAVRETASRDGYVHVDLVPGERAEASSGHGPAHSSA